MPSVKLLSPLPLICGGAVSFAENCLHTRGLSGCPSAALPFRPEPCHREGLSVRRCPALVAAVMLYDDSGQQGRLLRLLRTGLARYPRSGGTLCAGPSGPGDEGVLSRVQSGTEQGFPGAKPLPLVQRQRSKRMNAAAEGTECARRTNHGKGSENTRFPAIRRHGAGMRGQ